MIKHRTGILAALIALFIAVPAIAPAADMSIGAASWYAWWKMEEGDREQNIDPAILYGPILSIGFAPRWSLSSIFLYGKYEFTDPGGGKNDINRFDSDTAINFSINKYVKIFGGPKFMGYTQPGFSHLGLGPALGVGLTLPLSESFFVLWNISGAYLWGEHNEDDPDGDRSTNYVEPGMNTNLSLAYYIDAISTTITLGYRYQIFGTFYDSDRGTDMTHQFRGVTLSAVYSFGL
jgi:hypothetical protein